MHNDPGFLNMLSPGASGLFSKLKELTPNLEKLIAHQREMVGLFTNDMVLNKNCAETNQRCEAYLQAFDEQEEGDMESPSD